MARSALKLGISAMAVTFGASFFQRLLRNSPDGTKRDAIALGFYSPPCPGGYQMDGCSEQQRPVKVARRATHCFGMQDIRRAPERLQFMGLHLAAIYATCIVLAAKLLDFIPVDAAHARLVHMTTGRHLYFDSALLEMDCMRLLEWRLGPAMTPEA